MGQKAGFKSIYRVNLPIQKLSIHIKSSTVPASLPVYTTHLNLQHSLSAKVSVTPWKKIYWNHYWDACAVSTASNCKLHSYTQSHHAKREKSPDLERPIFWLGLEHSNWWFQPLWKICKNGNLPQTGVKINKNWNYHPGIPQCLYIFFKNLAFGIQFSKALNLLTTFSKFPGLHN